MRGLFLSNQPLRLVAILSQSSSPIILIIESTAATAAATFSSFDIFSWVFFAAADTSSQKCYEDGYAAEVFFMDGTYQIGARHESR